MVFFSFLFISLALTELCVAYVCIFSACVPFLSFSWLVSPYCSTQIHGFLEVNYLSFFSTQKHLQLIKVSLSFEPSLTFLPSA